MVKVTNLDNFIQTFNVGDRVESLVNNLEDSDYISKGTTGTVVKVHHREQCIAVEWDVRPNRQMHSCNNSCENGRGWNIHGENIRHLMVWYEPSISFEGNISELF